MGAAMGVKVKPSIDANDVIALFDDEERAEFRQFLSRSNYELSNLNPDIPLKWVVKRRTPFLQMISEINDLLQKAEARIKGNIDFLLFQENNEELQYNFNQQIRRLVAASLDWSKVESRVDLKRRVVEICQLTDQLLNEYRPQRVKRDSSAGRLIRQQAQLNPNPTQRYAGDMAANMLARSSNEYNTIDFRDLEEIEGAISSLLDRLTKSANFQTESSESIQQLRGTHISIETKLFRTRGYLSSGYPVGRKLTENTVANTKNKIEKLREALISASDLTPTRNDIFDCMSLEFWKQRWRLYELWLLARCCHILIETSDEHDFANRIVDGRWDLKFTKDENPILQSSICGEKFALYYQYFSSGVDRGNMPDIAIQQSSENHWIVILDPKSGKTYTKRQLDEVCIRYSNAFSASLSCVANYFQDEEAIDILKHEEKAVVFYRLRPDNIHLLDKEIYEAFRRRGIPVRSNKIVVLFDISGSTGAKRSLLKEYLTNELKVRGDVDMEIMRIYLFSDRIEKELPWPEFSAVENDLKSSGGTNFNAAFEQALKLESHSSGLREVWFFSDGAGRNDWKNLADSLVAKNTVLQAWICSTANHSELKSACAMTGGNCTFIK